MMLRAMVLGGWFTCACLGALLATGLVAPLAHAQKDAEGPARQDTAAGAAASTPEPAGTDANAPAKPQQANTATAAEAGTASAQAASPQTSNDPKANEGQQDCEAAAKSDRDAEGADNGSAEVGEAEDTCKEESWPKFAGIPAPLFNPQLDFGVMLMGMLVYPLDRQDTVSPPSYSMIGGMYTTNNSWAVGGVQQFFWDQDNNRVRAMLAGARINYDFYGTGDANASGFSFPMGTTSLFFAPQYLRRIWDRLYIGPRYTLIWAQAIGEAPADAPEWIQEMFPLQAEDLLSGLGVVTDYDSRDNQFSAITGIYTTLQVMVFNRIFGSDADYAKVELAANGYLPLYRHELILAGRGFLTTVTDGAPEYMWPAVGRGADLRGYAYGRYADLWFMSAQAELRWDFWWRFGAVVFGGLGTTTHNLGSLGSNTPLPSYGGGLRFTISEKERMKLRFDVAGGNENAYVYFGLNEAF